MVLFFHLPTGLLCLPQQYVEDDAKTLVKQRWKKKIGRAVFRMRCRVAKGMKEVEHGIGVFFLEFLFLSLHFGLLSVAPRGKEKRSRGGCC